MLLERDKDAIEMLDSSRTFTEKNLRELIGVGGNIFLFVIIGSCFKYFVDYNVLIMQFASPVKEKKRVWNYCFLFALCRRSLA